MVNEEKRKLGTNRSCIRDLFEYGMARAAEIGRENVFDFSIGNPSVPAPAGVNGTIAALAAGGDTHSLHRYTSAAGAPEAREAIAKDLNDRFACGARARDLFLTCGAAPALTAVLAALAVEDAETLIFAPFFPEYTVFAASAGMKNVIVPADTADFQIHAETAAKYLTEHTQAVIVNSPNNPSGVVYSRESLAALAARQLPAAFVPQQHRMLLLFQIALPAGRASRLYLRPAAGGGRRGAARGDRRRGALSGPRLRALAAAAYDRALRRAPPGYRGL